MIGELFRFGLTSLTSLLVKFGVMAVCTRFAGEIVSYAVVQIVVFGTSYLMHSLWTFRRPLGWASAWGYFQTIVFFLVLDYVIFTVAFARFGVDSTVAILVSTALVFVARFFAVRRKLVAPGGTP